MNDITKNYWNNVSVGNDWLYYKPDNPERLNDVEKIIENPERAFPSAVYPLIKEYMGDLRGKKVCVPSSGDNKAVFGFYLLGAKVTSCDIAENQLKNAKLISDKYNWDIEFICQDSMSLEKIKDGEYDLIYTSNGVHVWISDLPYMYKNFYRVLKKGGYNIFFETHPMIRPFDDSRVDIVKIKKLYEDTGPFGNIPNFSWRMQDFINALSGAGFNIKHMEEFHTVEGELDDYLMQEKNPEHPNYGINMKNWKENPWAALPQCLCLCSQK